MIKVTCAVLLNDGQFLICQRSEKMKLPLKWEFPGGKLEETESLEECLIREIEEELDVKVTIEHKMTPVIYNYPTFSVNLIPFLCTYDGSEIVLKEHKKAVWCELNELESFDIAEADKPIIDELKILWNSEFMKPLLLKK